MLRTAENPFLPSLGITSTTPFQRNPHADIEGQMWLVLLRFVHKIGVAAQSVWQEREK